MNPYITGTMIRRLREGRKITQAQLAEQIHVSDKAVSKWENGRGYPDITLIAPLAEALGVSVAELFAGQDVVNTNRSFRMTQMKLYVCPVCGNILQSTGEAVISCCGIRLPALEAEEPDARHAAQIEKIEDEYCVTIDHAMEKDHFISFAAAVKNDGFEIRKLYPEGGTVVRFPIRGTRFVYYYCNRHGLYKISVR